jgi:hypothetical protein
LLQAISEGAASVGTKALPWIGRFCETGDLPPTAVRDKQRRDDIQTAALIKRGVPTAPVTTGGDI